MRPRFNKFLLSAIGMWPYQSATAKRLNFSLGIFGVCIFFIPQFTYVLKYLNNFDNLLASMPTSLGAFVVTMKLITFACKTTEARHILDKLREDWNTFTRQAEQKILENYAENGRRYTLGYALLVSSPVLGFILYPLQAPILDTVWPLNASRPRMLPHPVEYYVDQDKYYYLLLLSEYIGYFYALSVIFGLDTLYIILIQHCCGMLTILRYRLEHTLIEEKDAIRSTVSNCKEADIGFSHMVQCIQLHIKIKKFAELISSAYTIYLSVDIILGIVMHSTASVMIVVYVNQPTHVIKYGCVLIAQSLRLFLNSWPGQKIMDHSIIIATATYNVIWYRMSTTAKKLLLFLLMDAQKPYTITMAKLYIINLDSFSMVMRTSLSYCTVMASLHG